MKQEINKKVIIKISEEDFKAYEKVRVSGVINMFDIKNVCMLSNLDKDKIVAIMTGYKKLIQL